MEYKNTFVQSKMNKDLDERLLPKGEYPHAENIRVIDSGSSHIGAIENDLGNTKLTNFNLTNAFTIGVIADSSNQKIYFFTTSDEKDLVVEYDVLNTNTTILLEASKPNSILNFNKNYLITGLNIIVNEDFRKNLLAWTDNINPPRIINIERAKGYLVDGFTQDDISVIKKPPVFAPTLTPTYSQNLSQNNLENKFLSFGYRYKYLDGEYSAISPYTYYYFTPLPFQVDYYVLENSAMVNQFNSVRIEFNTGDERVTDVELIVKESNSNTLYIVETFNKEKLNWLNSVNKNYTFSNSKLYIALPDTELARSYDNVPRLAKSQEIVGNRLVYGNFLENYNMVDKYNQPINIDYSPSLYSLNLDGQDVDYTLSTGGSAGTNNYLNIDFTGIDLIKGSVITFYILLEEQTYDDGRFNSTIPYVLEEDFDTVDDLILSSSFNDFVTLTMTNIFTTGYTATPPVSGVVQDEVGFEIVGVTGSILTISSPYFSYLISGTPPTVVSYWGFIESGTSVTFRNETSTASMKSNRSYEVGLIYLDEQGRASTVQTSINNTVHIPHINAINQNKLRININNTTPYWADRYKIAVKQNKNRYYEIYANTFYVDGVFRWIKIEGTNKDKIKENDTLIIKSDLNGFVPKLTTVRVLELVTKESDFIENNVDNNGANIVEQSGLYMKIKIPSGVDINYKDDSFINRYATAQSKGDFFYLTVGAFSEYDTTTSTWVDIPIIQGSQIFIDIGNTKYGSNGGNFDFEKNFIVGANYDNIKDWFDTEVTNIFPFTEAFWERGTFTSGSFGIPIFTPSPTGGLYLRVRNRLNGNGQHPSYMEGSIDYNKNSGLLIFETEAEDKIDQIYFESSETFMIENGYHKGNIQDQETSISETAVCEIDYYNCFSFGNGSEANSYRGAFNTNWVNIDLRPSLTTIEEYKENRRYADMTYSQTYNEGTGINGLNEFNLSRANFKEDIEKKYGSIQKLFARDTDIMVFQEDKTGYVLYGKSVLNNVDGTGNVGKIEDVLGQYIPYVGEYGISNNPESMAVYGNRVYFTDTKRGVPLRLGGNGLVEINDGMTNYFKDSFKSNIYSKKPAAYDPDSDQYTLLPDGYSINPSVKLDCSKSIQRSQFNGSMEVIIEYGILKGDAGFSYSTNGVPVLFTLMWNGNIYSTGFVGDSSYNDELVSLGYAPVSSGSIGSLMFDKDDFYETAATIEIFTPFDNVQFQIAGTCIISPELKVICVITNDSNDTGNTLNSRYKWQQAGYSSPYKNFYDPFSITGLTTYDESIGSEGSGIFPLDGSTIKIETFKDFTHDGSIEVLDRLGYLVSDTLYTESEITTLLEDATFLSKTTTNFDNGDILVSGSFTFDRLGREYLYLIWDYDTPPVAVDDFTNCETSGSVIISVMSNDIGNLTGYYPVIVDSPSHGSVIVNVNGTITYTHSGDSAVEDSFTYQLYNGFEYSNIANVELTIALSCEGSFAQAGGAGIFSFQISFGLATGECGITYDSFTIPDSFEIVWNGSVVATTGGLVSGSGTLLFDKTTPLPSTATINCFAPQNGTAWTINGICPMASPMARQANLQAKKINLEE